MLLTEDWHVYHNYAIMFLQDVYFRKPFRFILDFNNCASCTTIGLMQ